MDKEEFLKQEFITLREEIKQTKDRIFKIMGFGLIAVPTAHFLAKSKGIDALTLSLPVLIIVVALIYLSENNALMRCGRYIKRNIEPEVDGIYGWEKWLELTSSDDNRAVDKYLAYAFYLLFLIYLVSSTYIAVLFAYSNYGIFYSAALLGAYIAIGIWFVIFLIRNIQSTTSTYEDHLAQQDRDGERT